jgi:hypothetical protein
MWIHEGDSHRCVEEWGFPDLHLTVKRSSSRGNQRVIGYSLDSSKRESDGIFITGLTEIRLCYFQYPTGERIIYEPFDTLDEALSAALFLMENG